MKNVSKTIKTLAKLSILTACLALSACASQPKGYVLPPALSEVYRNGQLKGLEQRDGPDLGMPNQNDRVTHVCRSQPIYSLEGYYIRTDVTCF